MKHERFSERLLFLRTELLKLKQREFADSVGIRNPGYLSELERGQKENPSPELLQKISSAWGVSREWLEHGNGEPYPEGATPPKAAVAVGGVAALANANIRYEIDHFLSRTAEDPAEYLPITIRLSPRQLLDMLNVVMGNESEPIERRLALGKFLYDQLPTSSCKIQSQSQSQSNPS